MRSDPPPRQPLRALLGLIFTLSLVLAPTIALAQVTASPSVVDTGKTNTVDISVPGSFDLSQVDLSHVGIRPNQGVSNVRIDSATAQHMSLSFDLSSDAATGTRTLFVNNSSGSNVIALDILLKLGSNICQPACTSPAQCVNNVCATPHPPPPPPPPPRCTPACVPPRQCINGTCQLPQ